MANFTENSKFNSLLILDGATGTEIARLGGKMDSASWCAVANKTNPEIVKQVHEEYLRAGVDIITTNTFATCRHVLEGSGLGDETKNINRIAVNLAKEACENVSPSKPILIAGSMSNTVAWKKGTGSPDLKFYPPPEKEIENYKEMSNILAESGVDLIILEMMLDIERSSRILEIVIETGLPVWVGISCSENDLGDILGFDLSVERSESTSYEHEFEKKHKLIDIITSLKVIGGEVYGIMHTSIPTTYKALEILFNNWSGPTMVYPEIMTFDYSTHQSTTSVSPDEFSVACRDFANKGVQVVGGCCGTTIEHICKIVDDLSTK